MIDRASMVTKVTLRRGSPGGVRRDLRQGLRSARRRPAFWLALMIALALGIGTSTVAIEFVRSGRLDPAPVASPAGLPIPPAHLELLSETADPERQASTRMAGAGARSSRAAPPTTIADQQRRDLGVVFGSLFGAAAVVLLVTVSNLTLLMLARGGDRRSEIATRSILGAGRWRLVRQLLTEHVPLLLLGAALGAALAGIIGVAVRASWPLGLSEWLTGEIAPEVIAVTFGAPILAVALTAIIPVLMLDEHRLREAAGAGARVTGGIAEGLLRHRLTVLGVATSVTLLVAAGLLFRGFGSAGTVGVVPFDPADTITFVVRPAQPVEAPGGELADLNAAVQAAVEEVEGVQAVSVTSEGAWLGLGSHGAVHSMTGSPVVPGITGSARYTSFSPAGFSALRTTFVAGRDFAPTDGPGTPAVAIINRTFANRFFFDLPVGRRVQLGRVSLDATWFRIIGIVEDFRPMGIGNAAAPEPMIAFSARQLPPPTFDVAARFAGDPHAIRDAIERALASAAPDAIVEYTGLMEEKLEGFRRPLSWVGILFGALAGVAALLAAYGLHGLISYNVRRRTREIGIRIALGAPPAAVVRALVRDGMKATGQGMVLGIAGALCVGRLFQFTFTGVQLVDPLVYLPVLALTAGIALVASYLPARAAARVNPVVAFAHD